MGFSALHLYPSYGPEAGYDARMINAATCNHPRSAAAVRLRLQCPTCKYFADMSSAKKRHLEVSAQDRTRVTALLGRKNDWMDFFWPLTLNIVLIVVSVHQNWRIVELIAVFWAQSVAIGISTFIRLLRLRQFRIGKLTNPDPTRKVSDALLFLFHYGFFHTFYLYFMLFLGFGQVFLQPAFLFCLAIIAIEQVLEHRHQSLIDRQMCVSTGLLTVSPYLRLLPIHLIFIFGGGKGVNPVVLFGFLKTISDMGMLLVNHHRLQLLREIHAGND